MADLIATIIYLITLQGILFFMFGLVIEAKSIKQWNLAIISFLVCISCEVLSCITVILALKDFGIIKGF